jgi:lysine-specific demethylase 8
MVDPMSVRKIAGRLLAPLRALWKTFGPDAKAWLKYGLFRWVLPRLGYEPFTIRNIGEKAWPTVGALTARQDFSGGVERIDWGAAQLGADGDDGSDLLSKYAENSTPVVLEGYAKSCPMASWSMESLKAEFAEQEVQIKVDDYVAEFGKPHKCTMRLGQFVDYLTGSASFPYEDRLVEGAAPYLSNESFAALAERLPQPEFFERCDEEQVPVQEVTTFWLGSANAVTPMHCHHFCDTVVFQLIGSRSFTLVPPHQAMQVGYVPHTLNIGTASLDPYAADRRDFPGWDEIQCLDVHLNPGDVLLLPGFWFHAVRLSEPSMSACRFLTSRMPASIGGGPLPPWKTGAYRRGW